MRAPIRAGAVALLLALAPALSVACETGADCSSNAWGVYLPNDEGTPAPNIELANFQHMNPQGLDRGALAHDELMRLHAAVKPLAAAAFAKSTTAFEVMIRYTLTPDGPAVMDMQTTGGEAEHAMLSEFHDATSALVDFHSIAPVAYVVFHYRISPAGSTE